MECGSLLFGDSCDTGCCGAGWLCCVRACSATNVLLTDFHDSLMTHEGCSGLDLIRALTAACSVFASLHLHVLLAMWYVDKTLSCVFVSGLTLRTCVG